MPKDDARRTRVRLRTKKNPDGSQQYVRGNTVRERVNTTIDNRDAVRPTPAEAASGKLPRATVLLREATKEELRRAREKLMIKRKKP
jgi:hypothetical protein